MIIDGQENGTKNVEPSVKSSYSPLATVLLQKRIRIGEDSGPLFDTEKIM